MKVNFFELIFWTSPGYHSLYLVVVGHYQVGWMITTLNFWRILCLILCIGLYCIWSFLMRLVYFNLLHHWHLNFYFPDLILLIWSVFGVLKLYWALYENKKKTGCPLKEKSYFSVFEWMITFHKLTNIIIHRKRQYWEVTTNVHKDTINKVDLGKTASCIHPSQISQISSLVDL